MEHNGLIYDWELEERDKPWKKIFETKTLRGFGPIPPIILTPNGDYLIYPNEMWEIRVWSTHLKSIVSEFYHHNAWISCLLLTKDSNYLFSGSYDQSIAMWDLSKKTNVHKFRCTSYVCCLSFTEPSQILAAGCSDGSIFLWELQNSFSERQFYLHKSHIISIKFLNDDILFTIANDNLAKFWNCKNSLCVKQVYVSDKKFLNVAYNESKRIALVALGNKLFSVLRLKFD